MEAKRYASPPSTISSVSRSKANESPFVAVSSTFSGARYDRSLLTSIGETSHVE